nr:hypothetical protein [Variovorax paradoxus]
MRHDAGVQVVTDQPQHRLVGDSLAQPIHQDVVVHAVEDAPESYVVMQEATKRLGVTRQTVLHRVQRGELDAVLVCRGRQKGLRIKVLDDQPTLFDEAS